MDKKSLLIGLLVIVIIVIGGGFFWYVKNVNTYALVQTANSNGNVPETNSSSQSNTFSYSWNPQSGTAIAFQYPSDWKVEPYRGSAQILLVHPADVSIPFSADYSGLLGKTIIITADKSCQNTQCLNIYNAGSWMEQLGAQKLSDVTISGYSGYHVQVPGDNTFRYILSHGEILIDINTTNEYAAQMDKIVNSMTLSFVK